ncbi:HNH endonuclease [Longitalea luteola]|uniref:HNH endonuclease n=1 Tax=Longitalea luteola TaxID=2812563 RepID=UPI001A95A4EC|nr:HNH endonuclease [Longitalea luteola]
MICIFCKKTSDNSKSVEHIIPESLGNKAHVLPRGIVCDDCNQYFAIKIEKEVLEQDYFKYARAINGIKSKKNHFIPTTGILLHPAGGKVDVFYSEEGIDISLRNNETYINLVASGAVNKIFIPAYPEPDPRNIYFSRFICKVALEALALKFHQFNGWEADIIDKKELDPLRHFARFGPGKIQFWHYHERKLYPPSQLFTAPTVYNEPYEVLHEFDFHYSQTRELFFIMVIMGVEYAINMGGPEIDTYIIELENNGGKSFLERTWEKRIS